MLRGLFQNPADVTPDKLDLLFVRLRNGEDELKLLSEYTPQNHYNQNSLHRVFLSEYRYLWQTCLEFIGHNVASRQGDKTEVLAKAYEILNQRMSYISDSGKHKDRPIDLVGKEDTLSNKAYVDLMIVLVTHGLKRAKAEELLQTEHGSLLPYMLKRARKLYAHDMLAFLDCGFLSSKELTGFNGFAKLRKTALQEISEHEKYYYQSTLASPTVVDEDGFVLVDSPLQQFHMHARPVNSAELQHVNEREHTPVEIRL